MLEYSDINLYPKEVSILSSRDEADTSIEFCGRKLSIPLIAAPMPDIGTGDFVKKIIDLGSYGFIHRFCSIEEQVQEYLKAPEAGCAIGVNEDWKERFLQLYDAGCTVFIIDTANGASVLVRDVVRPLRRLYNVRIIVGNVCNLETYIPVCDLGIDYVRVSIGSGKACSTKTETGIYNGTAKAVYECGTQDYRNIIADGGIREPQDMCKALVLGAEVCMAGSIFAACADSPAEITFIDNEPHKIFRGCASESVQVQTGKSPKYIEGNVQLLSYQSKVENLINRFKNGLRSSMSYMNAKTLKEYREKSGWYQI